jgi:hypothetical protein
MNDELADFKQALAAVQVSHPAMVDYTRHLSRGAADPFLFYYQAFSSGDSL